MNFIKLMSQKNLDYHSIASINAVFLGDSVTHGCFETITGVTRNVDVVCDFDEVYHNKFKKLVNSVFPYAPLNIINSGISGQSAPKGLSRLDRDVIRFAPDLAVINFGLNDCGKGIKGIDEYIDALGKIFKKLNEAEIETIFITPNMMCTYVSPHLTIQGDEFINRARTASELQNSGIMDKYMDAARQICGENKVPVCDCYMRWKQLYAAGVDVTALLVNYINHPTREMHGLFARELFQMLMFEEN